MNKVKLVVETKDTEYEFVGNQVSTHDPCILFRSHGPDGSVSIGEVRFIHKEVYYCRDTMAAMDGTFFYWTPVYETVSTTSVFNDLIGSL